MVVTKEVFIKIVQQMVQKGIPPASVAANLRKSYGTAEKATIGVTNRIQSLNQQIAVNQAKALGTSNEAWKKRYKTVNATLGSERKILKSILPELEGFTETGPLTNFNVAALRSEKALNKVGMMTSKVMTKSENFGQVLAMDFGRWKKMNEQGDYLTKRSGRWADSIRKVTHGFRGFRMELLGVMFFGMGIQRFFMGLLTPALQAAGIFDLISTILTVLFLPVALKVLDWVLWFWDILSKSESLQKLIRWLTIFGVIAGTLLFLLGMFGLGIGSLIMAISSIIMPIIAVITAIFGFIGSMIVAIVSGGKWLGILALIAGIFGIIVPGVSAMSDKVKESGGIWETVKGIIGTAISAIKGFLDSLWEKFLGLSFVKDALISAFGEDFYNKLKDPIELIKGIITKVLENMGISIDSLKEKFAEIKKAVSDTFEDMKKRAKAFIDEQLDKIIKKWDEWKEQNSLLVSSLELLGPALDKISTAGEKVYNFIKKVADYIGARPWLQGIIGTLLTIAGGMIAGGVIGGPAGIAVGGAAGAAIAGTALVKEIIEQIKAGLEGRQFGGYIKKTGPYMLHAGETVVPSTGGGLSFSPTINIYASTKESILYELNTMVREQLDRIMR